MVNYTQPLRKFFMGSQKQRGFSLVELLVVVAVLGLIAAIAIPSLLGARTAAQNADAVTTLRSIGTLQMMFRLNNTRYARLAEINQMNGNTLGKNWGPTLRRHNYVFQMSPTAPTPEQLESYYRIFASGQGHDGTLYQFRLEANGEITQIRP
jgi:prepilin-type N-terminal cleavage/methylation domain-containing protein